MVARPMPAAPLPRSVSERLFSTASGFQSTSEKHRAGSWCPICFFTRSDVALRAARRAMRIGLCFRKNFFFFFFFAACSAAASSRDCRCAGSPSAPSVNASMPGTHSFTKHTGTNWCSFGFEPGFVPFAHTMCCLDATYHNRYVPGSNPGLRLVCTVNAAPSTSARRNSKPRRSFSIERLSSVSRNDVESRTRALRLDSVSSRRAFCAFARRTRRDAAAPPSDPTGSPECTKVVAGSADVSGASSRLSGGVLGVRGVPAPKSSS
mmetsp:Transcript_6373/g.25847  ORF Transcript_6373/g.25847 Transcript_6373/m.25847 type:complete len:264 (+) Transcript_6373:607-1398(+)